tara:strand:- start:5128 stop:5616 length:489 start_codon:yes stop_codon:yes gene_type:complete
MALAPSAPAVSSPSNISALACRSAGKSGAITIDVVFGWCGIIVLVLVCCTDDDDDAFQNAKKTRRKKDKVVAPPPPQSSRRRRRRRRLVVVVVLLVFMAGLSRQTLSTELRATRDAMMNDDDDALHLSREQIFLFSFFFFKKKFPLKTLCCLGFLLGVWEKG